jgi:membrane-associated phospholipid phosphatase
VRFLTDFADQAVILPMVLAVSGVLAAQGWRRGAVAWLAAIAGTSVTMLALKLAFLACSPVFGPADMRSPSGHVAAAAVVAGGLAALLLRGRASVLPVAALAGVVIGVSRVALGMHSVPEVVLGALVGLAGAAALAWLAGPPPPGLRLARLVGVVVLVAALCHGLHLPAEAAIRHTALNAARFVAACQAAPGAIPSHDRPEARADR